MHMQHMLVSRFIKQKKDLIQKVNMQSNRKITKSIHYFSMLIELLVDWMTDNFENNAENLGITDF